ncbi:MAG: tetratricopeptide repeat protein [bacterium]|nr:tetratricopeptide repeat protein [bacterium]
MLGKKKTSVRTLILCLVLLPIITAAFLPSLSNGFTNWDEPEFIHENADIKELSPENVRKYFTKSYMGFGGYVPLVLCSFALEYKFFGSNPTAFHAVNLLLHIICGLLVFYLVFLLTRSHAAAFVTALLFGIHPLHVENVAWILGRKDLLFALFYLAASISYIRYLQNNKKGFYLLTLVMYACSLLSKVAAISLPLVLLLLDYYFVKKITTKAVRNKIPMAVAAVAFLFLAFSTTDTTFPLQEGALNYGANLAAFFYSFVFYVGKTIIPIGLSARYPAGIPGSFFDILMGIAIFACVGFLVYRFSKRKEHDVTFGVSFFLLTLLPTLPFHFIGQPYADRYAYLPLMGIFFIAGLYIQEVYQKKIAGSKKAFCYFTVICLSVVAVFSVLTRDRCLDWKDSIVLWSDVIEKNPVNPLAHLNRGEAYMAAGLPEKAIVDLDNAIKFQPTNWHAYNNRGIYYLDKGRYKEAFREYSLAIKANPEYFRAYINRGNLLGRLHRYQQAAADFTSAIKLNPSSSRAYYLRGITWKSAGQMQAALDDFTRLIALNSADGRAYFERARVYIKMKRMGKALNDFNSVLSLSPDNRAALLARASVLINLKHYVLAATDLDNLPADDPGNARAYFLRGKMLLLQENLEDALANFNKSISIAPDSLAPYYGLLEIFKRQSKDNRMEETCRQILELTPDASVANRLGLLYGKRRLFKEAVEQFLQATQWAPEKDEYRKNLKDTYVKMGLKKKAREVTVN